MSRRLALIALLGLLGWPPPAPAQLLVRFASRAHPELYLHVERGRLEAGRIEPQWWSAQWTVEPMRSDRLTRWRNRWKPDLHLELGPAEAAWRMEILENGDYVRLRSQAGQDRYLVLRQGQLLAATAARDDHASHWRLASASEPPYGGGAPALGSGAARRARNAAAGEREWILEAVGGLDMVRVREGERPTLYYHLERGPLQSSAILPGWWSAQWQVVRGGSGFRLRNRWKPDQFLYFDKGTLASGPARPERAGAQWQFVTEKPAAAPPAPPASDRWHGPN